MKYCFNLPLLLSVVDKFSAGIVIVVSLLVDDLFIAKLFKLFLNVLNNQVLSIFYTLFRRKSYSKKSLMNDR